MKRFVVMHDYGSEGWVIVGEGDSITEAVAAREHAMQWCGGGTSEIFQHFPATEAYALAHAAPGQPLVQEQG